MGETGERFTAVRGAVALLAILGAARLPAPLAGGGLALATRIAPAPEAEDAHHVAEVHVPAQRRASAVTPAQVPTA